MFLRGAPAAGPDPAGAAGRAFPDRPADGPRRSTWRLVWAGAPDSLGAMAYRPTAGDPWQPLFDGLKGMKAKWPTRGFSWDSRHGCVASSFSVQFETQAREAAALAVPAEWTSQNIAKAPPHLRELADRFGGVRSRQLLLVSGPVGGIYAFGLWWPWDNGMTISMRVGLANVDVEREPYPRLRDVFGITF